MITPVTGRKNIRNTTVKKSDLNSTPKFVAYDKDCDFFIPRSKKKHNDDGNKKNFGFLSKIAKGTGLILAGLVAARAANSKAVNVQSAINNNESVVADRFSYTPVPHVEDPVKETDKKEYKKNAELKATVNSDPRNLNIKIDAFEANAIEALAAGNKSKAEENYTKSFGLRLQQICEKIEQAERQPDPEIAESIKLRAEKNALVDLPAFEERMEDSLGMTAESLIPVSKAIAVTTRVKDIGDAAKGLKRIIATEKKTDITTDNTDPVNPESESFKDGTNIFAENRGLEKAEIRFTCIDDKDLKEEIIELSDDDLEEVIDDLNTPPRFEQMPVIGIGDLAKNLISDDFEEEKYYNPEAEKDFQGTFEVPDGDYTMFFDTAKLSAMHYEKPRSLSGKRV